MTSAASVEAWTLGAGIGERTLEPWLIVQPLRVVDHAQDRPHLGGVGQQRQHGQADQERIGRRPAHQPEGHTERPPLPLGQPVHGRQEGDEQLVNRSKAQSHL